MKFDREILQVLCPYGKWRHAKGMQIVDEESAKKMGRAAVGNGIEFSRRLNEIDIGKRIGHE